jgi:signal transduction histidine kinase
VLDRLAKRAGAALHGAAVVAQLRTAREDLLRAREEEHRRLRRDLHDDLAPTLAGLGMRSAAVATLITTNPTEAARAAEGLEAGIRRAAEQVREIAYDLRPRLLDDRGLVEAVRDRLLRDVEPANLSVTVEADDLGRLPAAIEAAAFRIVSECVENVRRHAQASACVVTLRRNNGNLHVEVSDDGHGMARARSPASG